MLIVSRQLQFPPGQAHSIGAEDSSLAGRY